MDCSHCGKKIGESAKFCDHCGKPVAHHDSKAPGTLLTNMRALVGMLIVFSVLFVFVISIDIDRLVKIFLGSMLFFSVGFALMGIITALIKRKFNITSKLVDASILFVLMMVFVAGPAILFIPKLANPSADMQQANIERLSTMSALPASVITIYGKFDLEAEQFVDFSDGKGYYVSVRPVLVKEDSVDVGVPPYFNTESWEVSAAVLSISVRQKKSAGEISSNLIEGFNVNEIPAYSSKPGAVTLEFIDSSVRILKNLKNHASMAENESPGSVDPALFSAVDARIKAYADFRKDVASVVRGTVKSVPFMEMNGVTLSYDKEMLADADKLLGALMYGDQQPAPISGSSIIDVTGDAVEDEFRSYYDPCGREFSRVSDIFSCGAKRMGFDEAIAGSVDVGNRAAGRSGSATLGRALTTVGLINWVGYVAPLTTQALIKDIEITAMRTGKDPRDMIVPFLFYHVTRAGYSAMDIFVPFSGTLLGSLQTLVIGTPDVQFNGILMTPETVDRMLRVPTRDEGRTPDQTGLDMIICDVCPTKLETTSPTPDWAVFVGVEGEGRIMSDPAGIRCKGDCTEIYPGSVRSVTLTAKPGKGNVFKGWKLNCAGTGSCVLSSGKDYATIAMFETKKVEEQEVSEEDKTLQQVEGKKQLLPVQSSDIDFYLNSEIEVAVVYDAYYYPVCTEQISMPPDYTIYGCHPGECQDPSTLEIKPCTIEEINENRAKWSSIDRPLRIPVGGVPPYTFTASGLPNGIIMDPVGVLRGTEEYGSVPNNTVPGYYDITICASDSSSKPKTTCKQTKLRVLLPHATVTSASCVIKRVIEKGIYDLPDEVEMEVLASGTVSVNPGHTSRFEIITGPGVFPGTEQTIECDDWPTVTRAYGYKHCQREMGLDKKVPYDTNWTYVGKIIGTRIPTSVMEHDAKNYRLYAEGVFMDPIPLNCN